jgi:glucose uptake protein
VAKWRFELFSFDFAIGALVLSVIAAYTLGTLGSDLGFGDSLLVAGTRLQVLAALSGAGFALGNMLYLGSIALLGLANATLLAFTVFGCSITLLQLGKGHYVTSILAVVLFAAAAVFSIASARIKNLAAAKSPPRPPTAPQPIPASTKGIITGILAGIAFAGAMPVLAMAQPEQFGVGAYGGVLLASIGILVATFFLNFFFLNISLEGGVITYATYLTGTPKIHFIGGLCGAVWAAGMLALYAAYTGSAGVTSVESWMAPFAGALIAVITGMAFWQKIPQPPAKKRNTLISTVLFVLGVTVLLFGFHKA